MVSGLFCFLCFTSSVSLTSFYTEDDPELDSEIATILLDQTHLEDMNSIFMQMFSLESSIQDD